MSSDDSTTTLPRDVDLELVARLRIAVARLNRQLRQQSGSSLPLTLQSALVTIEKQGPLSLGDLAVVEQIAPATVTKIVTKLLDQGLISRTTDPDDRRVSLVELTAAGARQLAESRSRRNAFLATQLEADDSPDAASLRATAEVLERLAQPAPSADHGGDER